MKQLYPLIRSTLYTLSLLLCGCLAAHADITAIGNTGQTVTSYPSGTTGNVPIYIWCSSSASPNPGALNATPTTPGTYTFKWYKFDVASTSWQAYSNNSGSSSMITNLSSGGYRVEVENGSGAVLECFHTWVWNLGGSATIATSNPSCTGIDLSASFAVQDTFKYYTPPPSPSYINANTEITVCFSANHTYVSDLAFYLVAPPSCGNTIIPLTPTPYSVCNSGNDISNLCFSTTSTTNFNICNLSTPLTGTFGAFNNTPINWSPLIGCNALQGGWKVQIFDCIGGDVGKLTSASITFSNLTSVCGSPTSVTYSSGSINSAIYDNSCNSGSASKFNVPISYTAIPLSIHATRTINWSSTSGVSFASPGNAQTSATVPPGSSDFSVSATYAVPNTSINCTVNASQSYTNTYAPELSVSPSGQVICSGTATNTTLNATIANTTFDWTVNANGVSGASSGSGNTITQTLNATGNTPGTVIYTITPYIGSCSGLSVKDTVTVNPVLNASQNISICTSQLPYTWNGQTINAGGNAVATYSTTSLGYGCDSTTTLNLTVNPLITATQNITICANQLPYIWNGQTINTGGNAVATYTTTSLNNGCDSTTTLNLTVNQLITATQSIAICANQLPYTWNGQTINTGGNAAATYTTTSLSNGCDSTTTLNLTVKPLITATQNITICASQLPYTWNGQTLNAGGNAAATYTTTSLVNGCDSTTTLNLTVNPLITATQSITICADQLPYAWNGLTVTAGGTTAATYTTAAVLTGCDSTTTLNLTVNPLPTYTQSITICANQLPYTWNGLSVTAGGPTAATYTTASALTGCDSTTTLNLTVNPLPTATQNITICASQLPYTWNGQSITAGGNAVATYTTASALTGCDSTTTLNLTVNPLITATQNITICANQLPYTWNGQSVTAGGSTAATYTTAAALTGCDSTTTLNLTVNPLITATQNITICANQLPYTWNGLTVTAGGPTAASYVSPSALTGCDSTTTLNLTVNPMITPVFTAITPICPGGTISLPLTSNNGITGTWSPAVNNMATTTYTFTPTPGLCAYTTTMTVVVKQVSYGTQTAIICDGESYTFNGISYTSSNYTATDTLINAVGCDSIITLDLTVMPVNPVPLVEDFAGCGSVTYAGNTYTADIILYDTFYTQYGCDSVYHQVNITVFPEYHYTETQSVIGCGSYVFNGTTYYDNETVLDTLYTVNGCDSVYRTTHIEVEHFDLDLDYLPEDPYEVEYVTLNTSNADQIPYEVVSWTPATLFESQTLKVQKVVIPQTTTISVIAMSQKGCYDTVSRTINVRPYSKEVMMPNAFTPNGDGRNDVFKPVLAIDRAYQAVDFRIYNRMGQILYSSANVNSGWDGTFQGVIQGQGVYHYTLTVIFADGTRQFFKGDITLIR